MVALPPAGPAGRRSALSGPGRGARHGSKLPPGCAGANTGGELRMVQHGQGFPHQRLRIGMRKDRWRVANFSAISARRSARQVSGSRASSACTSAAQDSVPAPRPAARERS